MSITTLRFTGKIPAGKFEFGCPCGFSEFNLKIEDTEEQQSFICSRCGRIYDVWQQNNHWHITIGSK